MNFHRLCQELEARWYCLDHKNNHPKRTQCFAFYRSIYLSLCLPTYLSTYQPTDRPTYLPDLPTYLLNCLCLYIHLYLYFASKSISISISFSIYICTIYLLLCLSMCVCMYIYIYIYICVCVCVGAHTNKYGACYVRGMPSLSELLPLWRYCGKMGPCWRHRRC